MPTSLDAEQRAAVEATEKVIAVLAGPGSGKTRVLSCRARELLRHSKKSNALMLTFTNKAAAEMKSRALRAAAVPSDRISAGTFHAFGQSVLRAHGHLIGIPTSFEICDRDDQDEIGKRAAAKTRQHTAQLFHWGNSRRRREKPSPDLQRFGNEYEDAKRREGVVDFDDLLVYTAEILESHSDVAEAYGKWFTHILIDEFQDTNALQFAIVKILANYAETVGVFADDDQAIFQFAGADSENVSRFIDELGATHYPLTINYRCRAEIVNRANLLIQADGESSGRQMRAVRPDGEVDLKTFTDVESEAKFISQDIQARLQSGVKPEEISILVRSGFRASAIVRTLAKEEIPVTNWLDLSQEANERRILRACLAVVREKLSPACRSRLAQFFGASNSSETNTEAFLQANEQCPGISQLIELHEKAKGTPALEEILDLVHDSISEVDAEIAFYVDEVLSDVRAFTKHDPDFSLEHLLSELSLGTAGGAPTEGGGVKLASLHRTKGLQWPVVYMVGLEHETLPDHRSLLGELLRHERRLCFVGVCRAEDTLVLTHVWSLSNYPKRASDFLQEMDLLVT